MIRAAKPADLDPIVDMCREFIAEGTYAGLIEFDRERFTRLVEAVIGSPAAVVLVADGGSGINGMIAVMVEHNVLTGAVTAGELFWWVRPDHRGTLGWRLAKAAEAWGREHGATQMRMGAPDDGVGSMLERGGFKRAEIMYQKELC